VIAAAVTIFLLITFNSFVYYSIAPSGDWVSMYRSPLETMLSTIIAMLVIAWLYGWYRRDRVQRAMSGSPCAPVRTICPSASVTPHRTLIKRFPRRLTR
jgi:hypothetical protein